MPERSGARRGVTTWRELSWRLARTAYRADAPTCATARWSIYRSQPPRNNGDGQRIRSTRPKVSIARRGPGPLEDPLRRPFGEGPTLWNCCREVFQRGDGAGSSVRDITGLSPRPSEDPSTCSCRDHASTCAHRSGAHGVGARLDESPELLFRLRAVDETELLSDLGSALPDTRTKRDTAQTLVGDDLAALFGLDMEESEVPAPSRRTDAISAGPRKKTRKTVIVNIASCSCFS